MKQIKKNITQFNIKFIKKKTGKFTGDTIKKKEEEEVVTP